MGVLDGACLVYVGHAHIKARKGIPGPSLSEELLVHGYGGRQCSGEDHATHELEVGKGKLTVTATRLRGWGKWSRIGESNARQEVTKGKE